MDLHVIGPLASPAERAAVDAVLGPPESGWVGGPRRSGVDGTSARGGHAIRARRSQLLPALHAVQDRVGWISQPALNYISKRLAVPPAEAYGVATFYALYATRPRPPVVAHVCDDIACRIAGAERICDDLRRTVGPEGEAAADGRRGWLRSPCLGLCDLAPGGHGHRRRGHDPSSQSRPGRCRRGRRSPRVGRARAAHPAEPAPGRRRAACACSAASASWTRHPSTTTAPTTAIAPWSGPWSSGRTGVIAEITASGLMGRGGAAFPTGRKWAAVAAQPATPKYVVCNADESEPGTFKDRVLLEGDPFAIIEAMTIAGFAIGAQRGYLYLRGEYPEAEARVTAALEAARAAGLLGAGHPRSRRLRLRHRAAPRRRRVHLRRGDGALRIDRGQARRAAQQAALPGRGRAVRQAHGRQQRRDAGQHPAPAPARRRGLRRASARATSTGPKLFCLSGHVARPGTYEVEFGATLGDLIELAGGVAGTGEIRAILLGGAAGVFVGPSSLDMPLTFEATRAAQATLGSGVIMVFDTSVDLVDTLRRIAQFFRDESCGQCVPCRVGSVRQEELLARLAAGSQVRSRDEELVLLREIGQTMRDASICGLGQTASSAIESALRQPELVAL